MDCLELELIESGRSIRCIGLRWMPPADVQEEGADNAVGRGVIGGVWPVGSTSVEVLDQSSAPSVDAVTLIPPPLVTAVQPEEAGPGDTISIRGEGFGIAPSDVVNLTLGGVPCEGGSADWFQSTSELQCSIPFDHPLWTFVALNPGAV